MPFEIVLNDLSRIHTPLRREMDQAIGRVLDSNWFLRGREVDAFEEEWAAFCGQRYCVACASGTDALSLAASAMGVTEANVQSNTLALTAIGLHRGGVKVTIVDVDENGQVPASVKQAVPVLLFGRAPTASELNHPLFDAAHAHGWLPPKGAVACWSFYPTKTLGALGDCGAVTTDDANLAKLMRELAGRDDLLRDSRQLTSRADEIQAAVLRVKLKHLRSWLEERAKIAEAYRRLLPSEVQLVSNSANDLNHLLVVKFAKRDLLKEHLTSRYIETKVHFAEPLHVQSGPWDKAPTNFSQAEEWCNSILTLPCFPGLKSSEITYVTETITKFIEG